MSKAKTTAPVTDEEIPSVDIANLNEADIAAAIDDTLANATDADIAAAADAILADADVTDEPKSEAEELFDQVMAEDGEKLMAEVHAEIEENGLQLTPEESAAIKEQADAALAEADRLRKLTPEEYEAEFGFKFPDGISIAEQTIQKSSHVHKDRIFGLLQKIRELYVG